MNNYNTDRMNLIHITLAMAVSGLVNIVERFGDDHRNDGDCVYVEPTETQVLTPRCIVGVFAHDLGVLRCFITPETQGGSRVWEGMFNLIGLTDEQTRLSLAERGVTFDDDAYQFLSDAQVIQDDSVKEADTYQRNTWRTALDTASQKMLDRMGHPHRTPAQHLLDLAS